MALPEPKPDESVIEVDRDNYKLLTEARAAIKAWTEEAERLKKKIQEQMGDATAGTVDGRLVTTWRPKETWREAALIKDYPDLTQHYFVTRVDTVFDMGQFRAVHPEIAEKYQSRVFEIK